ncbi:hypothetical protein B0J17DRAFT_676500 [Rhizoctonia solani]|nr:hypothetical protein B0J17DRAFT_676500 [Rhizoctonia solani]
MRTAKNHLPLTQAVLCQLPALRAQTCYQAAPITHPPLVKHKLLSKKLTQQSVCRPSGKYIYHSIDRTSQQRFDAMAKCLSIYLCAGSKRFITTSLNASWGQSHGAWFQHGSWNKSILEDKDIAQEIKLHLQQLGKYACAEDVVQFLLHPETRAQLNIPKVIRLCTAQRWMSQYGGFCWRAEPKGQYFDGHEQDNVVKYRQSIFVPFWRHLERLRTIYNEKGEPDPERPMTIHPGEKPIIFWFHDESVFYGNDRRMVRWVHVSEHAKPYKKGEGNTIMITDFICPEFGWLRGKNG